jgi:benzoyl-CoA reductase/2-hydroxyglutaryl-CoA dehydratase subunit BcrC/BadD/HgdB
MRATGSTSTELADAYFTQLNCSFPRHCFNLALSGEFEFIDGLVCINSCDHIRRLYDNWKRFVAIDFIEFLSLPRQTGPDQVAWYREELALLKGNLEKHFGVEISDDALRQAITLANDTRRLQRRLYELRKHDKPPITGAQTLAAMVAGTAMPKDKYNELLQELLARLSGSEGTGKHRARLMITGGILDDPAYVNVIEDQGGLVVTDVTCFGTRLMWRDVDQGISDPLTALAQYYLVDRPSCPRLYDKQEERTEFVTNMYRDFNCDGIIGERMMFCDQWQVEQYMLATDLKEGGIPFLKLDREYITAATGQLRTRVQAFIEAMGK